MGPDRTAATATSCNLSAGWLGLCGVKNTAPVRSDDPSKDQLPAIPGPVKERAPVSEGPFLLADTAVRGPNSMVNLAIGTAAGRQAYADVCLCSLQRNIVHW